MDIQFRPQVQIKETVPTVKSTSPINEVSQEVSPKEQALAQGTQIKVPEVFVPQGVEASVNQLNARQDKVSFEYQKELNIVQVSVKEASTDNVIAQIPTRDFLESKQAINDMVGVLLDKVV